MSNLEKIKRPKNPFFKFKDEVFRTYQKKYPELKGIEVVPVIAKDFKKLSKSKMDNYNKIYKKELVEYKEKIKDRKNLILNSNSKIGCKNGKLLKVRKFYGQTKINEFLKKSFCGVVRREKGRLKGIEMNIDKEGGDGIVIKVYR